MSARNRMSGEPVFSSARHAGRIARFGGAGVLSAITDFAVFAGLIALGAHAVPANIASFLAANVQSYFLNARLTFREVGAPARVSAVGYGKFLLAHFVSLALSTAIVAVLAPETGALWAKVVATGAAAVWNYAASVAFVFRSAKPGAVTPRAAGQGSESASSKFRARSRAKFAQDLKIRAFSSINRIPLDRKTP